MPTADAATREEKLARAPGARTQWFCVRGNYRGSNGVNREPYEYTCCSVPVYLLYYTACYAGAVSLMVLHYVCTTAAYMSYRQQYRQSGKIASNDTV